MRRLASLTLSLVLALSLLPPAVAGDDVGRRDAGAATVLLTFTVADHGAGRDESARVIHLRALDGRRARLQTGWRLPIPTTTANTGGETAAVTSYQYQDVGMTVSVECRIVGDDRLQLSGNLELSAQASAPPVGLVSGPPSLSTLNHHFEVALTIGTDTVLAQVPGPDGGEMTLSVRTSIES